VSDPFDYWPLVPIKMRPRTVYVQNIMPSAQQKIDLELQGYILVDVRGLSDEIEAVQALLQGIAEDTIECDPKKFKFLELRARTLGMTAPKIHTPEDDTSSDKGDIDDILASIPGDSVEQRSKSGRWSSSGDDIGDKSKG
jgi:hypothetical protein